MATDVAARGLDVEDLTHVINYGLPDDVENYTHRSGRTGRAGKRGTSISIIHLREKGKVRTIERVIGKKFEEQDLSYGKMDLNVFFMRLQEQDDEVASWADSTVQKLKQVLNKILIENEYIDGPRAQKLNPVLISSELENAIRANNDEVALPAFNCFF